MDPISGVASIIGCIQGIQLALKSLKAIKDAPNELRQLSDELDDISQLTLVVANSRQAILEQIQTDNEHGQIVARNDHHLAGLEGLIKDINTKVFELYREFLKCLNSKGEFSRLSLSMIKWIGWRKAKVVELLRMAQNLQAKAHATQTSIALIEQYAYPETSLNLSSES